MCLSESMLTESYSSSDPMRKHRTLMPRTGSSTASRRDLGRAMWSAGGRELCQSEAEGDQNPVTESNLNPKARSGIGVAAVEPVHTGCGRCGRPANWGGCGTGPRGRLRSGCGNAARATWSWRRQGTR